MSSRPFISLTKNHQRLLRARFPELLALIVDGYAKGFHRLAVSVFDHWLSVVSG